MPKLSRRDFLKLAGLASGAVAVTQVVPRHMTGPYQDHSLPNVIVLVFDTMSATNLSLYGYPRETTPNFSKFAERAIVYHAHQAGGNFTTPGTASLLTGTYPWTHRAINIEGLIQRDRLGHNVFQAFGTQYNRLAFSQNLLPNYFFGQFEKDIETILSPGSFSIIDQVTGDKFGHDLASGYRTYDNFLFQDGEPPASLIFGLADRLRLRSREAHANGEQVNSEEYPRGLPRAGDHPIYFRLRDIFDGLMSTIDKLTSPYLAYLHLFPPHEPFKATKEFDDIFQDNFRPKLKPLHRLGDHTPYSMLNGRRLNYDQYIANVDDEFGRLTNFLESRGIFEESYVVVTSDHGESFERGVEGHITPLLYEPLVHILLMVLSPGQKSRQDVYTPTNSVDVLPTLLHIKGGEKPDWVEGELLPGLGGVDNPDRGLFTVEAKLNPAHAPLTVASIAMRKGSYKMIYYTGYESEDSFELYDLKADPEELHDLYPGQPAFAITIKEELLEKLDSANSQYRKS